MNMRIATFFLAATIAFFGNHAYSDEPSDVFFEATMALNQAIRMEKNQDFKAAAESSREAQRILKQLKDRNPFWNPEWVSGKIKEAERLEKRVVSHMEQFPSPVKQDYSLKPGEWRDHTMERAYKAHAQHKPASIPDRERSSKTSPSKQISALKTDSKKSDPASVSSPAKVSVPSIKQVTPTRTVPSTTPPRGEGRFRIGS
jgi:Sec7-like guanine-nucleotide exchange factor